MEAIHLYICSKWIYYKTYQAPDVIGKIMQKLLLFCIKVFFRVTNNGRGNFFFSEGHLRAFCSSLEFLTKCLKTFIKVNYVLST